jgi:PIN domain nuclease of toxin-antitoxin system
MGSHEVIVLDTCAIVWDALEPGQLSKKAKNAIQTADTNNELLISDISMWEICMLVSRKRIEIEDTTSSFINSYLQYRSICVQPISPEIAALSVSFGQEINSDPADRIISATSILKGAKLVTADKNLIESAMVATIW